MKIILSKAQWEYIGQYAGWSGFGQHLKEDVVPCKYCGTPTKMTGTKECDRCWEIERAILSNKESQSVQYKSNPELAIKIRNILSKSNPEPIGHKAGNVFSMVQPAERAQKGRDLMNAGPEEYLKVFLKRQREDEQPTDITLPSVYIVFTKTVHRLMEDLERILGEEWENSPKSQEWKKFVQEFPSNARNTETSLVGSQV